MFAGFFARGQCDVIVYCTWPGWFGGLERFDREYGLVGCVICRRVDTTESLICAQTEHSADEPSFSCVIPRHPNIFS